jgi:hypothetical protein
MCFIDRVRLLAWTECLENADLQPQTAHFSAPGAQASLFLGHGDLDSVNSGLFMRRMCVRAGFDVEHDSERHV